MIIRKKDIKLICDSLSTLAGPICFYRVDGSPLYETSEFKTEWHTEYERNEVIFENTLIGYFSGGAENPKAVKLFTIALQNILEKKSLTTHALQKYKELSFLAKLNEIFSSSVDLDHILSTATQIISQEISVENCSIMVMEPKSRKFILKTAFGKVLNEESWLTGNNGGIADKVMESGNPVITNEPEKHPDFIKGGKVNIESLLCLPLKQKEKVVGVLNLSNKTKGIFTSEDESLLSSISTLIAEGIENFRLLEEKITNEKFTLIGQMAGGIIHDLKNPMAAIQGFAELLAMELTSEERARFSDMVVKSVHKLVDMVEDLLVFSRGNKIVIVKEKTSVESFFGEIISFIESDMASKNIEVKTRLSYSGDFNIDRDRFQRAVFNISGNAKEVLASGGRFLALTRLVQPDSLEIVFSDTGEGIPDDIIDDLFEPFVTKGKKRGTGLGLAITKSMVEEHSGSIKAVNGNYSGVEGFNGANFVIRLPLK